MSNLTAKDFSAFFAEIHGYDPFPWQRRLAEEVISKGEWPDFLDLPTGSGKTAAIDIAVFHLAIEADRGPQRKAPIRIAFVVDRRLVVDDSFERSLKIAKSLANPPAGSVRERVVQSLKHLAGDAPALIARRLRGGVPREDDWAHTPIQPTILCSTVDQIGSRLMFRGYGVSDRMKSVHAGLIGSDCLILLDEAHLAEPFRQTLGYVKTYQAEKWRETRHSTPWGTSLLTATPGEKAPHSFKLQEEDYENEVLKRRLEAKKIVRLLSPEKSKAKTEEPENEDEEKDTEEIDRPKRVTIVTNEVKTALAKLQSFGIKNPAIGIVVNRVGRARAIYEGLKSQHDSISLVLMIGPARPLDRDKIAKQVHSIHTDSPRNLEKPLVIVATQCIEAGVDIDLDALITEAAPVDALRQRFGRLNRAGRKMEAYASVFAIKSDLSPRRDDPVYGSAIKSAWAYLTQNGSSKSGAIELDFGLKAFQQLMEKAPLPIDAISSKNNSPVLLPAHLELLSQTSPIPSADPEIALYLHGKSRQSDSVTVIWRGDILQGFPEDDRMRRLLLLIPPRSTEAIELPVWAVRSWLERKKGTLNRLADIPLPDPEEESYSNESTARAAFRWRGDDESSTWILSGKIRPGDTLIVPAIYGGMDEFGWNPSQVGPIDKEEAKAVLDIADEANDIFAGRRFAVRIAPGLLTDTKDRFISREEIGKAITTATSQRWQDLKQALESLNLSETSKKRLSKLDHAKGSRNSVRAYTDIYTSKDNSNSQGIVFVAQFGIKLSEGEATKGESSIQSENLGGSTSSTEDDAAGSVPGFSQTLEQHSQEVRDKAQEFTYKAGLPSQLAEDISLAGFLHDAGKADPRFQAWLSYGDPLGPDPDDPGLVLAKSGRWLPSNARTKSKLPDNWRHEAFSVRLAMLHPDFIKANDPGLVLWLIGTHHGYGRPFFPHLDPHDQKPRLVPPVLGLDKHVPPGHGPQSLAFDFEGLDWATLYQNLKARYGVWELARMEAIIRLADHRASEDATILRAEAGENK